MGHHAYRSGLGATHDHQIVVDVLRKPHGVKRPGCLPWRGPEGLLSPEGGWKQEGCRACKPGDDELAAAILGCCNQHAPDPCAFNPTARLRDSTEPRLSASAPASRMKAI